MPSEPQKEAVCIIRWTLAPPSWRATNSTSFLVKSDAGNKCRHHLCFLVTGWASATNPDEQQDASACSNLGLMTTISTKTPHSTFLPSPPKRGSDVQRKDGPPPILLCWGGGTACACCARIDRKFNIPPRFHQRSAAEAQSAKSLPFKCQKTQH